MSEFIGVNIGCSSGMWKQMAQLSAERMEHYTGIPCYTMGDEMLREYDLPHSVFLKLKLFEKYDAENILLFDADSVCLREWDPTIYAGKQEIVAVRDRDHNSAVTNVAKHWDMDPCEYFGSGLVILNRTNHECVLNKAYSRLSYAKRSPLKEQDALNWARQELNIPVQLLSKRYSFAGLGTEFINQTDAVVAHAWGVPVHIGGKKRTLQWLQEHPPGTNSFTPIYYCDPSNGGIVDGAKFKWFADDKPTISRIIEFRYDNTFGQGHGIEESYWLIVDEGNTMLFYSEGYKLTAKMNKVNDTLWKGVRVHNERPHTLELQVDV